MGVTPEQLPVPRPTLPMCGACKGVVPAGARFCGHCGQPVVPDAIAAAPPAPPPRANGSGTFPNLGRGPAADRTLVDARPPWFAPPDRPTVQLLGPGAVVGEFRIEKLLGMGAMGTVYGAVHPVIGRRVAIKILRQELVGNAEAAARFVREAQALGRIRHPHVIDVLTFGTLPEGAAWFAMEWLEGETLRQRLGRSLSLDESCRLVDQLAVALEALHGHGVVHRDLKPDNVFLVAGAPGSDGPSVKVLDFGVAKLTDHSATRARLTKAGFVVGSAEYASPEQAAGHAVDERADIYSLGVVLFELATGRRPFEAASAADLFVEHMVQPAPAPSSVEPSVPPAIDKLVLAMLAKEPAQRPTLAAVRATLSVVRGALADPRPRRQSTGRPTVAPPPTPAPADSAAITAAKPAVRPLPAMAEPVAPIAPPVVLDQQPRYAQPFRPAPARRIPWGWLFSALIVASASGVATWWFLR